MKMLRLYAPAIVLLMMAVLSALHVGLSALAFFVLAGAVYLHVREEINGER